MSILLAVMTMVVGGLSGFITGVVLARRERRRVEKAIAEAEAALKAVRERCRDE